MRTSHVGTEAAGTREGHHAGRAQHGVSRRCDKLAANHLAFVNPQLMYLLSVIEFMSELPPFASMILFEPKSGLIA